MTQTSEGKPDNKHVVHVDAALEHLILGFLKRQADHIEAILRASALGDFDTVWTLGHNMKGAGGGYGFDAITTVGLRLQQAASDKDYEEIRTLVDELSTYLKRVEVVYE